MNHRICVFCSASDNVDKIFFNAGRRLGELISQHGDTLVWGGGKVGLMGSVARATRDGGGKIIGIIPDTMTDTEIAFHDADELIVTKTMRQRKLLMDERANAFVVLPGGFGTLEELAEIMVLRILSYHDRPIVLVNINGFYDPLLRLFDHFIESKFAKPAHLQHLHLVTDPDKAYQRLERELTAGADSP